MTKCQEKLTESTACALKHLCTSSAAARRMRRWRTSPTPWPQWEWPPGSVEAENDETSRKVDRVIVCALRDLCSSSAAARPSRCWQRSPTPWRQRRDAPGSVETQNANESQYVSLSAASDNCRHTQRHRCRQIPQQRTACGSQFALLSPFLLKAPPFCITLGQLARCGRSSRPIM